MKPENHPGPPARPLILLCYPRIDFEENYRHAWIPYSLLYLQDALMADESLEVRLFDANQEPESVLAEWLVRDGHRLLCAGFSIMTGGGQIGHALELAKMVCDAAPRAVRIFGGPHANVLPEQTCEHPLVSMVATGPGHLILPRLAAALRGRETLENIPNIWYKNVEGAVVASRAEPLDWRFDGVKHWAEFDFSNYLRDDELLGRRTLNYISSMGCSYGCRFCYEGQYRRRYHPLSAEVVTRDIGMLADRLGLSGIKFYDADFFINPKRAGEIAAWFDGLPKPLRWAASIHPNDVRLMLAADVAALRKLAGSGCRRLLMGVESGSARVLNEIIGKQVTPGQILDAARAIDGAGIRGAYTFILGFPGETDEEKSETVKLAKTLAALPGGPEIRFHGYMPYPGTPMYRDALSGGFGECRSLEAWANFDYYKLRTPWLRQVDRDFIQNWSAVDHRRLKERRECRNEMFPFSSVDSDCRGIVIDQSLVAESLPLEIAAWVTERYPYLMDGEIPVTILKLAVPGHDVPEVAQAIAGHLKPEHYFAQLTGDHEMFIVFPGKTVRIPRNDGIAAEQARRIGEGFGIPRHQMQFEKMFETDHPDHRQPL